MLYSLAAALADSASGLDISGFAQYGVLGIVVVLLIGYARGQVNREKERTDKAEARVKELEDWLRGDYLPKIERSNSLYTLAADVLQKALTQLTELQSERDYMQRHIDDNKNNNPRRKRRSINDG